MTLTSREVALITASKISTRRVSLIATDLQTWIATKVTAATAIEALLTVSGSSKSPARLIANADLVYAALENDPPTITSITPATGTTAGGTAFTIVGTNLTGATVLTIGGTTATSIVVVNDTHITGVTPAKTAGAKDVIVTTPAGSVTAVGAYTYA